MGKIKQWKNGGEQDKFIEKLIRQGKVNKNTKPGSLKIDYPGVFAEFSENVIRNHLNLLKRSKELYLDGQSGDDEDEENERQENDVTIDLSSDVSLSAGQVTNIHHNYPVLCNTFKDPDNQFEKVVMAVLLPSGAQNVKVELSQDGHTALVKYGWPKTMYTMEDLFKKQLANNQTTLHGTKVTCFKDALEKVRERVDACPQAMIKINLPIKVQTAVDSWIKGGVIRDDVYVAYAEFKGHIKEYNKKINESQLVFDM